MSVKEERTHFWKRSSSTIDSVSLPICISVCMYVCLYVCLSVCLSFCLSVVLSVCRSVVLSVCLSVCPPPPLTDMSAKNISVFYLAYTMFIDSVWSIVGSKCAMKWSYLFSGGNLYILTDRGFNIFLLLSSTANVSMVQNAHTFGSKAPL